MISSNFDLEKRFLKEGYDFAIGVDEAGRGPLAGPVVAVVTTVRNFQFSNLNFQINLKSKNLKQWDLIRDSKTLSEKQREKMFDFIQENFYVGVGICDHKTIDRINILEATFLAAKKAITNLLSENNFKNKKIIVLFDGNKKIPNFSMEQMAVVGGDKIVKSISAASIIAKVTRDRIMLEAHKKYPQYGFEKHKGYGTKIHMDALRKFGSCEIHRQSFGPVKSLGKFLSI